VSQRGEEEERKRRGRGEEEERKRKGRGEEEKILMGMAEAGATTGATDSAR
jgi:hypothetical protein